MTPSVHRATTPRFSSIIMKSSIFRSFPSALLILTISCAMFVSASAERLKIGVINMGVLINGFHENAAAMEFERAQVEAIKKSEQLRIEVIEGVAAEIGDLKLEFEDDSLSAERRNKIAEEATRKQQTLMELQRGREDFLKKSQRELTDKMVKVLVDIREKIQAAVDIHAKEQGVDLVFDEASLTAGQTPFVLYAPNAIQLNDGILKIRHPTFVIRQSTIIQYLQ